MDSKRSVQRFWALLGLLLAAACAGPSVTTDYDPEVDFGALRRYAWSERESAPAADPVVTNDLLDARIRRAVGRAMASKGYLPAGDGPADFELAYHVAIERAIDVQTYIDAYPRGYRWGAGLTRAYTNVREYDLGSLVLDVSSAETRALIWQGATQARINEAGTPEERSERVNRAVDTILEKFPPQ